MNSTQAKNIDLPDLMARLGYQPVKVVKGGTKYWYQSPFRKEAEPSLNVSRGQKWNWVWNDFGDIGGTVIDFVMRLKSCSFKEALQFLEDIYERDRIAIPRSKRVGEDSPENQTSLFSFYQQKKGKALGLDVDSELEFIRADHITNPLIHDYLVNQRLIPRPLIDRYLKELRYRNRKSDKEYFAFGMENESGGYEIRVATDEYSFKSALKSRDITFVRGGSKGTTLNIFEGMIDFLSLCAMYNTAQLRHDSIIMHSLTSYKRAGEWLSHRSYNSLNLFLDNDEAGKKHAARFQKDFAGKVTDQSPLYAPCKDINQAWKENQKSF